MKKILIVDDNEDILLMLKNMLQAKGYTVEVTLTCDEGMAVFYEFEPDLVLLDVNFGRVDGRLICRKIKSYADYQHIPIILISANPDGLQRFSDYGAAAAVEKLFHLAELLSLIKLNT